MAECAMYSKPCRFFWTPSGCRYGEGCRFLHTSTQTTTSVNQTRPCKFFSTARGCRNGDMCPFAHLSYEKPSMKQKMKPPRVATSKVLAEKIKFTKEKTIDDGKSVFSSNPEKNKSRKKRNRTKKTKSDEEKKNKIEKKKFNDSAKKIQDLVKSMDSIKCSVCQEMFVSDGDKDLCEMLSQHYQQNFFHEDEAHLVYFRKDIFTTPQFSDNESCDEETFNEEIIVFCTVQDCYYDSNTVEGLLKHWAAISEAGATVKQRRRHQRRLSRVCKLFAYRDAVASVDLDGIISAEDQDKHVRRFDVEQLMLFEMADHFSYEQWQDAHSHGIGALMTQQNDESIDHNNNDEDAFLCTSATDSSTDDEAACGDSGSDDHLAVMMLGYIGGSHDSDDDMCGMFDEDDMFELACQGIKPWDPEAMSALAVLNGCW